MWWVVKKNWIHRVKEVIIVPIKVFNLSTLRYALTIILINTWQIHCGTFFVLVFISTYTLRILLGYTRGETGLNPSQVIITPDIVSGIRWSTLLHTDQRNERGHKNQKEDCTVVILAKRQPTM